MLFLFFTGTAFAEDPAFLEYPGQGKLAFLEYPDQKAPNKKDAFDFEAAYIGEFATNFSPGLVDPKKQTVYLDNIDLTLSVDTQSAGWWPGGSFFVYWLSNHGKDPTRQIYGDLQTASNIEAPNHTGLYEAWLDQKLSSSVSLLVGLHDLNSEFYVSSYSSLFLHSSTGTGPEMSLNVPVSGFPRTGLAARLHYDPTDFLYLQAAVYGGNPTTRSLKASAGKMMIGEGGVTLNEGTYKLGLWQHTAKRVFNQQTFRGTTGAYVVLDQELLDLSSGGYLGGFFRYGAVPQNRNAVINSTQLGFLLHGASVARKRDDLGLAYIQATTHSGQETVIELTYRAVLSSYVAIQPSIQQIHNPGANHPHRTLTVALLRFEFTVL